MAKRESVKFLAREGITLAQAAILFSLAQKTVTSVLPNITSPEELREYASVSDCPDLSAEDLEHIEDLYLHNFYLEPAPSPS
ncbi:MAG: aldo/keto reductase [Chloroflexi bacterium]|nr:aldo/keto reductase [Chloroflexota bacterium]